MKKNKNNFRYNEEDDRYLIEDILDFIKTFILCSLVLIFVTSFIITPKQISGRSMAPTLVNKERGFSNVINLSLNGINRYDIVVAKIQENNETIELVKRVVGLPNDTISCKDEVIYINGKPLDEPYLKNELKEDWVNKNGYFTKNFKERTLKADEYFLLGDNRPLSQDSRDFGPVNKNQIIAKDFCVLWPFDKIKYIK